MAKKTGVLIGMVVIILLVWQYDLVLYGISQGKGQLKVIIDSRNVTEVLQDEQVSDTLKQRIRLVQQIKQFAIDSLGLNKSESYQTLYDQHGKPVLWVVTACAPFSLQDKEWHFPLLGSFSYKGFFDYPKAMKEKARLAAAGYDTGIRTVSAWSTLGILADPIMSGMLSRHEGSIANTIIHELTHGTLFVKNDLKFNENLASFIGHEGAKKFLAYKYGAGSPKYQYYETYMTDQRRYIDHMLRGLQRLDSLYHTFSNTDTTDGKIEKKHQLIRDIVQDTDTICFANEHYIKTADNLRNKDTLPNNTFFKSYVRYQSEQDEFSVLYKEEFDENLNAFLAYLKEKYTS